MHAFPKSDLARLLALPGELRALALLGALRFVAEADLVRAGVPVETLGFLADTDLVFRLPLQRTLTTARPTSVFALRRGGAIVLARAMDVDAASVPSDTLSSCRRSTMFLDHALATSRFAILLGTGRTPDVELLSWNQIESDLEITTRVGPDGTARTAKPLVPDALAIMRSRERDEALVVEIDRGTERPSYMAAKYAAYAEAWRSGLLAQRFGTPALRVATVAPGEKRLDRLIDAAREATGERAQGLFWFATDAELEGSGIGANVWRTMRSHHRALWEP